MEEILEQLPAEVSRESVLKIAQVTIDLVNRLPGSLPEELRADVISEQLETAFEEGVEL